MFLDLNEFDILGWNKFLYHGLDLYHCSSHVHI